MSEFPDMPTDKMRFRVFQWLENPEEFGIYMAVEPQYQLNNIGQYDYTGIGPMCRVYTGRGVFSGPEAVEQFNGLQVLMATRVGGELYHPVWGTDNAYLTELQMTQQSRPDYIEYSFTFRGTDENGSIPWLPEQGTDRGT